MGIFSRFRKNNYEEYEDEDEEEYEVEGETVDVEAKATLEGSSLELKIFRPKTMAQLLPAVDHLRAGKTVLLNLEGVESALYRRMIDFISGAAYAMRVSIKKATDNSYCIAPNDVDVSGEAFENTNDDEDEFFDI
ncbi:MAG: cell division protein SepF [Clostridia bacterium]|nr:cell division protein SepF [Clostridia bacterium]